ncbi:MAG: hypothetical protein ACJAS1_006913 [Oleiphilaceae bacterium]
MAGYISYPRTVGDHTYIKERLSLLNSLLSQAINTANIGDIHRLIALVGIANIPSWMIEKLYKLLYEQNIQLIETLNSDADRNSGKKLSEHLSNFCLFEQVEGKSQETSVKDLNNFLTSSFNNNFKPINQDYGQLKIIGTLNTEGGHSVLVTDDDKGSNYVEETSPQLYASLYLNHPQYFGSSLGKNKLPKLVKVRTLIVQQKANEMDDTLASKQDEQQNSKIKELISALWVALDKGDITAASGIMYQLGGKFPVSMLNNFFALEKKIQSPKPLPRYGNARSEFYQLVVSLKSVINPGHAQKLDITILCMQDRIATMYLVDKGFLTNQIAEKMADSIIHAEMASLNQKQIESLLAFALFAHHKLQSSEKKSALKIFISVQIKLIKDKVSQKNWFIFYYAYFVTKKAYLKDVVSNYFALQSDTVSKAHIDYEWTIRKNKTCAKIFESLNDENLKMLKEDFEIIEQIECLKNGLNNGFFDYPSVLADVVVLE